MQTIETIRSSERRGFLALPLDTADNFELYCLVLALSYHEARDVRHLLSKGYIRSAEQWKRLIDLPKNRNEAWRKIMPVLEESISTGNPVGASGIFVRWFGVSLKDLRVIFGNEKWKHYRLGGNAWEKIAAEGFALAKSVEMQDQEGALPSTQRLSELLRDTTPVTCVTNSTISRGIHNNVHLKLNDYSGEQKSRGALAPRL
jgi:hypothetical protein